MRGRTGRSGLAAAGVSLVLALTVTACGRRDAAAPAGSEGPHPRIVAYSPALAALAFEVGAGDHVVGISRWSRLPAGIRRPVIGDAATADTERLLSVRPDLVLVQHADPALFEALRKIAPQVRVESFEIEALDDIPRAARRIAALTGAPDRGEAPAAAFETHLARIRAAAGGRPAPRVLFVMGAERPAAAGPGTFLAGLIEVCGGTSVGGQLPGQGRWRETDLESILRAAPEVLICQANPGGEAAARAHWMRWPDLPAARAGRVFIVSDPDWTIPTLALAGKLDRMFEWIHGAPPPSAEAAP